jgi:hypothetical protein
MTPSPPSAGPHPRLLAAGCYLFLLSIVAAIYAPIIRYSFVVYDDKDLILDNSQLSPPSMANLARFWTAPFEKLYVPLSYSLWWVAAKATHGVPQPVVFHSICLALHLTATALVFSILRDCLGGNLWPLAGALLFALHPLQVESVVWISETDNLLAGVLSLAAIRLYLVFARTNSPNRWRWYAAATLVLILALFAKPTAVVAPLIAGLLDWVFIRRKLSKIAKSIALWLCIACTFAIVTRLVQVATEVPRPEPWERISIAGDAMMFYLVKLFWPVHLTIDYVRPPNVVLGSDTSWAGALVFAAIVFLLFVRRRRIWGIIAGLAIMAIGLLPVLGLTPFDFQRISTVADRYMYIAMLGPALALAWSLARTRRWMAWGAMLIFIPLAWQTHQQMSHWRDSDALADYTLALDPLSNPGNHIAGILAANRGQWERAIAYDNLSLARYPDDGGAHYNLANALRAHGDYAQAIDEYKAALPSFDPDMQLAVMNNMGVAYYESGDHKMAESVFNQILEADPHNPQARTNLDLINRVPSK